MTKAGEQVLSILRRHGLLRKTAQELPQQARYIPADRGILFDTPVAGKTNTVDTYSRDLGDVYRVLPTASGKNQVSLDMHGFGPMSGYNVRGAASVADYYTKLLSDPKFVSRVGGPKRAQRLARDLSATTFSRYWTGDWRQNGSGYYNPLTANIGVAGQRPPDETMTHELGHRLYFQNSPYRKKIQEIMDRHGVKYSPVYVFPQLIPDVTPEKAEYGYLNQPTEQAAEFNSVRRSAGAYPGTGSGPNGLFVPEDLKRLRRHFDNSYWFQKKPDAYILDLLNEAKLRRTGQRTRVPRITV